MDAFFNGVASLGFALSALWEFSDFIAAERVAGYNSR